MESQSTFLAQHWFSLLIIISGLSFIVFKLWQGKLGIDLRLKVIETKNFMISMKTNDKKNILIDIKDKEKISLKIYNMEDGFSSNELCLDKRDLEYLLKFINSSHESIKTEHETN